ncbi:uncharacterized protein LOC134740343 [Pongo pygmaeus]|uniref:uncharacterized protein LOC134740343 n=1 Tax=Pongo pygmaeus TaxID=9600 RepID=UPI00300DAB88
MRSRHFLRGRVRSGVTLFLPSTPRHHAALACESLIQKGHAVRQRCRTGMGLEGHAGGMTAIWVTARGSSAAHSFSSPGPRDGFHLGHLPLERLLLAKSTPPETDGEGDSSMVPVLGLAFRLLPPTAQVERGGPCPYQLESIRAAVVEPGPSRALQRSISRVSSWLPSHRHSFEIMWPWDQGVESCQLLPPDTKPHHPCVFLSPLSVLAMGSRCGSLFPFTKVGAEGERAGKRDLSLC